MEDIKRVFMYHGAEHKSIFCYEHGDELTVENVKKYSRFHPRCGTSFLVLMILVSIFISFFYSSFTNNFIFIFFNIRKIEPLNLSSLKFSFLHGQIYINVFFCNNFIYVFIFGCAGSSLLHGLFSSCATRWYSLVSVHKLLIAVASLVVELPGTRVQAQ